ncbi:MAG: hypothetical protein HYU66_28075, partial [Armatimonadetes bacterium]|nr:hypothetical protein [Armatimonadota bacterium]
LKSGCSTTTAHLLRIPIMLHGRGAGLFTVHSPGREFTLLHAQAARSLAGLLGMLVDVGFLGDMLHEGQTARLDGCVLQLQWYVESTALLHALQRPAAVDADPFALLAQGFRRICAGLPADVAALYVSYGAAWELREEFGATSLCDALRHELEGHPHLWGDSAEPAALPVRRAASQAASVLGGCVLTAPLHWAPGAKALCAFGRAGSRRPFQTPEVHLLSLACTVLSHALLQSERRSGSDDPPRRSEQAGG